MMQFIPIETEDGTDSIVHILANEIVAVLAASDYSGNASIIIKVRDRSDFEFKRENIGRARREAKEIINSII